MRPEPGQGASPSRPLGPERHGDPDAAGLSLLACWRPILPVTGRGGNLIGGRGAAARGVAETGAAAEPTRNFLEA